MPDASAAPRGAAKATRKNTGSNLHQVNAHEAKVSGSSQQLQGVMNPSFKRTSPGGPSHLVSQVMGSEDSSSLSPEKADRKQLSAQKARDLSGTNPATLLAREATETVEAAARKGAAQADRVHGYMNSRGMAGTLAYEDNDPGHGLVDVKGVNNKKFAASDFQRDANYRPKVSLKWHEKDDTAF